MLTFPGLRRAAGLVFWPLAGAVAFLALYPDVPAFNRNAVWGLMPYVNHVLAFVALTTVATLAWGMRRRIIAGLVAGAVAIELTQAFVPQRVPALDDLVASVVGIAIGLVLMRACFGRRVRARA